MSFNSLTVELLKWNFQPLKKYIFNDLKIDISLETPAIN